VQKSNLSYLKSYTIVLFHGIEDADCFQKFLAEVVLLAAVTTVFLPFKNDQNDREFVCEADSDVSKDPYISGPCNSFNCVGHFKNVYDDDEVTYGRHLMNTTEQSVLNDDLDCRYHNCRNLVI